MNERTNAAQWSRKTKNEFDIDKTVQSFTNRLLIANRSDASIRSYTRALKRLYLFAQTNVYELEIDQIIDFLAFLKIDKQLNWRTIKIYVAGLRYFYQEMVLDSDLAKQIPYPKEKPSLPIAMCRTGELGSHIEKCNACGHKKVHYNSCGNRNCPNCQATKKEKWILDRTFDLLPVKCFHSVFTVPSQLRIFFLFNKKLLYNLLFRCVKETLFEFGYDPRQKMKAKYKKRL